MEECGDECKFRRSSGKGGHEGRLAAEVEGGECGAWERPRRGAVGGARGPGDISTGCFLAAAAARLVPEGNREECDGKRGVHEATYRAWR